MTFADIWNTSQKDYYILFIKRILSDSSYFFKQYGVKLLITSFWDTQYIIVYRVSKKSLNHFKVE